MRKNKTYTVILELTKEEIGNLWDDIYGIYYEQYDTWEKHKEVLYEKVMNALDTTWEEAEKGELK